MKYRLEYVRNGNCLVVHTKWSLPTDSVKFFNVPLDAEHGPDWVKKIFAIDGVASVCYKKYNLDIFKAVAFEWKEIIPLLLFILQDEFSPGTDLEEIKPPLRTMIVDGRDSSNLPEEVVKNDD